MFTLSSLGSVNGSIALTSSLACPC